MFANHQPLIAEFARQSPDNLARVIQLAILSARIPFHRMPADMEIAQRGDREALGVLFGWKWRAYVEIWEHRDAIADTLNNMLARDDWSQDCIENEALAYLASFHGLGFAKAGFALQMAYGVSGCLDTHILERFGIPPYIARGRIGERPMSQKTLNRRVNLYNATCRKLGGTAVLWDTWCQYIANRYPNTYCDIEHVSALHCVALGIEPRSSTSTMKTEGRIRNELSHH